MSPELEFAQWVILKALSGVLVGGVALGWLTAAPVSNVFWVLYRFARRQLFRRRK
jgi:hypothetical protein